MKGYVKKRKDGRWQGRIELSPSPDGKRRQKYVYADKRQECQRLVNEIIYQIESGNFADAGKLTVDGYMEKWFNTYTKKLEASTKQGYKNYVFNHINAYFKGVKLKTLKPFHVEEFYNSERKKYKEKTILQCHRIFSRALKDAVKNNLIAKNPCTLIDAPSPDEYIPQIPEMDIYFRLVDVAKGTEHEIPVLLAGMCGLRREEVFGLTWNDIDFKNSTLTVRQVITTAEKTLDKKKPKSKNSARIIAIPPLVLKVLKKYKSIGPVVDTKGKSNNPGSYSRRFKSFLKDNGIPHMRFHDLRHFHATLMLDAGVDLKHAQNRMGHSTVNMTIQYQHIREKQKADTNVVDKIDEFLQNNKKKSTGRKKAH